MKKIEKRKCSKCGQVIAFRVILVSEINCPFCSEPNSVQKEIQFELISNLTQPKVSMSTTRVT